MKKLIINQTSNTPKVELDPDRGTIEIAGWSLPEYANQFYQPILEWIDEYSKKPQPKTVVKIFFDYYNTSSSKYILNILTKLDTLYNKGYDVKIQWKYDKDDEDMKEIGEDFSELFSLQLEMVCVKQ